MTYDLLLRGGRVIDPAQKLDGNFDVAVKRAKKLAKVGEANLVKYQPPFAFGNLFRLLGKSDAKGVKVDLGFDFPRLQAGRMYFLSFNVVP